MNGVSCRRLETLFSWDNRGREKLLAGLGVIANNLVSTATFLNARATA